MTRRGGGAGRVLLVGVLVAAWLPAGAGAMSRRPEPTPCGAERHAELVGTAWSEDLLATREAPMRVLRPGAMATTDHRPDRLNIHLDADGRVTMLRCG